VHGTRVGGEDVEHSGVFSAALGEGGVARASGPMARQKLMSAKQVSQRIILLGAEHAIAGIAQSGHDIAVAVQIVVDGGGEDLHVGMVGMHVLDAFVDQLGATVGDFLDKPLDHGGMALSRYTASASLAAAMVLLILFGALLWRLLVSGWRSKDPFGMMFASGLASMILFQLVVNLGMVIGIMPITGIPLPFISHGGASLISLAVGLGIVQSINIRQTRAEW